MQHRCRPPEDHRSDSLPLTISQLPNETPLEKLPASPTSRLIRTSCSIEPGVKHDDVLSDERSSGLQDARTHSTVAGDTTFRLSRNRSPSPCERWPKSGTRRSSGSSPPERLSSSDWDWARGRLLHHLRGAQFLRPVRFVFSSPPPFSPFVSHAGVAASAPRPRD